jgi:hypothetical protein
MGDHFFGFKQDSVAIERTLIDHPARDWIYRIMEEDEESAAGPQSVCDLAKDLVSLGHRDTMQYDCHHDGVIVAVQAQKIAGEPFRIAHASNRHCQGRLGRRHSLLNGVGKIFPHSH